MVCLSGKPVDEVNQVVSYFDGLGRPMESIAVKTNQDKVKDIITIHTYDAMGREDKAYLPYTHNTNGVYQAEATALSQQRNFYQAIFPADYLNAFSQTQFEISSLNRPVKQAAPGNVWKLGTGKEVKYEYGTNVANEVIFLEVSSTGTLVRNSANYYASSLLNVTIFKDENWISTNGNNGVIKEYIDKQGNTVLRRTYTADLALDTYYVYDEFGLLRFVVQPEGSKGLITPGISTDLLEKWYFSINTIQEKG